MLEQLTKIIREYRNDDTIIINENTTLFGDLGLNSLDMVNLLVSAKEKLNIQIAPRDLKDIKTVGYIIKFAKK